MKNLTKVFYISSVRREVVDTTFICKMNLAEAYRGNSSQ
jgi:hypothetical protein